MLAAFYHDMIAELILLLGAQSFYKQCPCISAVLFCSAVEFLIMEGDNLSALAPNFKPFGGIFGSAKQSWVLVAATIMLPTVYLRNFSLLAYLSAAGVFTAVSLTCLVGWEGFALGMLSSIPSVEI